MEPPAAAAARENVRNVLERPCGLCNYGTYIIPTRTDLEIESLVAPAGNDPGKPRRVLSFGQEVTGVESEADRRKRAIVTREWVDIGFGVPAREPSR